MSFVSTKVKLRGRVPTLRWIAMMGVWDCVLVTIWRWWKEGRSRWMVKMGLFGLGDDEGVVETREAVFADGEGCGGCCEVLWEDGDGCGGGGGD